MYSIVSVEPHLLSTYCSFMEPVFLVAQLKGSLSVVAAQSKELNKEYFLYL